MKRIICLMLAASMLICLASCGKNSTKDTVSISVEHGESGEVNYPVPNAENYIEADCETGLRYTLTLHNYTDNFNAIYSELGGDGEKFSYTKWKKTKKDDEKYEYFYLKSGKITLTATVDKESLCLINVGCGADRGVYAERKARILRVSAVCALSAGGFSADDMDFFIALFEQAENYEDHCFRYENSIYIYDTSKKTNTVLFRVMPSTEAKSDEWNIKKFRDYIEG